MQNILILMGGVSTEHDISLITGVQAINNIDKNKYAIYPVVIDKLGKWHFSKDFQNIKNIQKYFIAKKQKGEVLIRDKTLYYVLKNKLKKLATIDCVLFCLHGGTGENGAIQGFIESMNLAHTAPEHTFSGIFMNKYLSKIAFSKLGIESVKCIKIDKQKYLDEKVKVIEKVKQNIQAPYFVKPNSQGSSIGISKANTTSKLRVCIEDAFCYDDEILVEETVRNLYELNIAVTRKNSKTITSLIERPANKNKILSFGDKYLAGGKRGLDGMGRELPAKLTPEMESYIKESATKIYDNFIKKGVVRIDYLVDGKTQKVYVGEVNTVPGSLSFYLWEGQLTFAELLSVMIDDAIEQNKRSSILRKSFDSSVLDGFSGAKGSKMRL